MQESAQAAFSYVRGKMYDLGISQNVHRDFDIHIHVPEGSVPKEGPSAGITIATAIISLMTGIPVSKKVAMSGEITLKGKVLPVGGIKEKLLAAYREGIKVAILPLDNKPDLKDLPKKLKENMTIHFVDHMDQVLDIALVEDLSKYAETKRAEQEKKAELAQEKEGKEPQAPDQPVTH